MGTPAVAATQQRYDDNDDWTPYTVNGRELHFEGRLQRHSGARNACRICRARRPPKTHALGAESPRPITLNTPKRAC